MCKVIFGTGLWVEVEKSLEEATKKSRMLLGESSRGNSGGGSKDRELVLDGNENSITNWTKGHSYYTKVKKLVALGSCPKILQKAKIKNDRIIYLVTDISKQVIQVVA